MMGTFLIPLTTHAKYHLPTKPVIQDEMGILSKSQLRQIAADNAKLAKLKDPQQIWVFTSNKKFPSIQENYEEDDLTKRNPERVSSSVSGIYDTIIQTYYNWRDVDNVSKADFAYFQNYYPSNPNETKYRELSYYEFDELVSSHINILIVSPKQKYPVAFAMSNGTAGRMGEVRSKIMSYLVNPTELSGKNVTTVAHDYSRFMLKHGNEPRDAPGLSWDQVTIRGFFILVILIWIVHHFYRKHHPKNPRGGGYYDGGYDGGYADGYYVGLQEDNDGFGYKDGSYVGSSNPDDGDDDSY